MTDVSPATEAALRSAMSRLLAGKPARTDGRLVKENLRKEAGVSRATMNRAKAILSEWDQAMAERGSLTPGEARRDEQIDALRNQLASKKRECTTLQRRLDAAATAIAALHHDNAALREQLDQHGHLRSLDARRTRTAR